MRSFGALQYYERTAKIDRYTRELRHKPFDCMTIHELHLSLEQIDAFPQVDLSCVYTAYSTELETNTHKSERKNLSKSMTTI